MASKTDGAGDKTTYGYALTGYLTSVVSPLGNVTGGTPAKHTTSYAYDPAGDLLTLTDQLGHPTSYVYDADANKTSVKDPDNNVTGYTYDAANELVKTTRANKTTLANVYDPDGNLLSQANAANTATTYTYDPLGHLLTKTMPGPQVTKYAFDAVGNLDTLTDPGNRVTTDTYDPASRLTAVSYNPAGTHAVSYRYDPDGHRLSMSDATGSSSYVYDAFGRLTSQTSGAGLKLAYGYDLDGSPTRITYPSGKIITNAYDAGERLASVTDWLTGKTSFACVSRQGICAGWRVGSVAGAVSEGAMTGSAR